jgi:hypothetical protein
METATQFIGRSRDRPASTPANKSLPPEEITALESGQRALDQISRAIASADDTTGKTKPPSTSELKGTSARAVKGKEPSGMIPSPTEMASAAKPQSAVVVVEVPKKPQPAIVSFSFPTIKDNAVHMNVLMVLPLPQLLAVLALTFLLVAAHMYVW